MIKFQLSPEVPILVVIGLLMLWARVRHFSWDRINQGLVEGVSTGIIPPIFIFILIGALISTWIMSGVIPSLMVFGFQLITARWFLPSVFLVCAIVGSAIGSALTVISTVGIAFLGMGITMGLNPAMIAGGQLFLAQYLGIRPHHYLTPLIWLLQLWALICLVISKT